MATDVILNGVTLNRSIQWVDRYLSANSINQVHKRTVDGTLVIFQKAYNGEGTIVLSGNGETGWFTKAMVDGILSFVGTLNNVMTLDFKGEIISVMFDWSSGNPVEFTPVKTQEVYTDPDWFTGEIRLIRV